MKDFKWLLPTYRGSLGMGGLGKHYGMIILCIGIPYSVILHNLGIFQSVEKYYFTTFWVLLISVALGYLLMVFVYNVFKDYIFYYPKLDPYFYVLGFIITYLVTNEIWGL